MIHDVDLELADGEIVGLVGANEAGKSTICLVASGLAAWSWAGDRPVPPGAVAGRATLVSDPDRISGLDSVMLDAVSLKFLTTPLTKEQLAQFLQVPKPLN